MALIILSYPSVLSPAGSIVNVTNAMAPGSQGLRWNYEQVGGWWVGARHYVNTLRIETSSAYVGPIQIGQFLIGLGAVQGSYYVFPLPEYGPKAIFNGIPTEQDTGSFLHTVDFKQESEDARQWLATFEYGPYDIQHELGTTNAAQGSVNPLDMAPEVEWQAAIYEESFPQDINGNPYLNTAGDPLLNPPKREQSRQTLKFTRNEQTYVESWAQAYRCSTNSDTFLGFQPNQAKCKNITGKRIYTADYGYFWQVSYEFEFRIVTITNSDMTTTIYGWEDVVLNAGKRKLVGNSDPRKLTAIIINGIPITDPIALAQDGTVLNSTWNIALGNTDPYYLIFQNFPQLPFAFLNIPPLVLTTNQ